MGVNGILSVGSFGATGGSSSDGSGVFITSSTPSINVTGTASTISLSSQLSSMESRLHAIESRLSILIPDPILLEKHQALKDAYDHYKLMEKLLTENL